MKLKYMYLISQVSTIGKSSLIESSMVDSLTLFKSLKSAKNRLEWLHEYHINQGDIVSAIEYVRSHQVFKNEVLAVFDFEYKSVGIKVKYELIKLIIAEEMA